VGVAARAADQTIIGRGATSVMLAAGCTHSFVLVDAIQPEPADLGVAGSGDLSQPSFTARASGTSVDLHGLAFGNGQFVAVGDGGKVTTSSDGAQWALRPNALTANLRSVTWGATTPLYVTVGVAGFNAASPDAITWTPGPLALGQLNLVRHAGSNFVSAGAGGLLYLSSDGMMWTAFNSHVTQALYGLAVGGEIVLFGAAGTITASSDQGLSWAQVTSAGVTFDLLGAAFGAGRYLALGTGGNVLSSTNLSSWSTSSSGAGATLNGVTWDGARFWAVGDAGVILSSSDGQSFTRYGSGTSAALYDIASGDGHVVAVGAAGTVVSLP
jgi:hypothetical protein